MATKLLDQSRLHQNKPQLKPWGVIASLLDPDPKGLGRSELKSCGNCSFLNRIRSAR